MPYDEWVKASGYGRRWKCECVFSDFKRIFAENVSAITVKGILREITPLISGFIGYKKIRADMMKITGNGEVVA